VWSRKDDRDVGVGRDGASLEYERDCPRSGFLGISALVIVTPGQDTALTVRNALLADRRARRGDGRSEVALGVRVAAE
jgi:hypothetical protein